MDSETPHRPRPIGHGSAPPPAPPPLPAARGRKAAWWAWPLILLCLLPLDWFADRLEPAPETPDADAAPATRHETSAGELALLKLQAQMVLGIAPVQPSQAETILGDMLGSTRGDRGVAALALLESFVSLQPKGDQGTAAERLEGREGEVARATLEALRRGVDEGGRADLRESLGWFAELAPTRGAGEPPLASSIRARARSVAAGFGLLVVLAASGVAAGGVLLFVHLRRFRTDPSANTFVPSPAYAGVLLECFALYLGAMVLGALLGAFYGGRTVAFGYAAAALLPLLWPRLRGMPWRDFRTAVGLHRGVGWRREIGAGCVGYLAVLAVASVGIAMTLGLAFAAEALGAGAGAAETGGQPLDAVGDPPASPGPEIHPIVGWLYAGGITEKVACLLLAAGYAPFFEEIFFRGAFHRYFRSRLRFLPSALLSSLVFAALHPQGLYGIPALAAMGVGFSLLREWRDSLIAPMTAHAINNAGIVVMLWIALY